MREKCMLSLAAVGFMSLVPLAAPAQEPPKVQIPQPGVQQIMTPAYEGDPEKPKVVPKDQWWTAPAQPEGGASK